MFPPHCPSLSPRRFVKQPNTPRAPRRSASGVKHSYTQTGNRAKRTDERADKARRRARAPTSASIDKRADERANEHADERADERAVERVVERADKPADEHAARGRDRAERAAGLRQDDRR